MGRLREFDPEAATVAGFGFDAGFAAHALDGFADDGQAHTGAFEFAGLIQALKHLEDTLLGAFLDADAVVFEPKANAEFTVYFVVGLGTDLDGGDDSGFNELH